MRTKFWCLEILKIFGCLKGLRIGSNTKKIKSLLGKKVSVLDCLRYATKNAWGLRYVTKKMNVEIGKHVRIGPSVTRDE